MRGSCACPVRGAGAPAGALKGVQGGSACRSYRCGSVSSPANSKRYLVRGRRSASWLRSHFRRRLFQPVLHVHLAVHRRRGREVLLRLLLLARAPVELAEAEVAVGDEGAHAELLGERERVTIVAVSVLRGIAAGGDLAEEPEGPRLVAALTALPGKAQGSPGEFESVLEPVREDVRFAQIPQEERLDNSVSHGLTGAQRVLQQRDALSNPPRERVGVAQAPRVPH